MPKRVDSTDVLDANAITKVPITVEIIGRYQPTGPNKWDQWELEREDGTERLELPARNKIQLEPLGAEPEIRLRWREGRTSVLRLRWVPNEQDRAALATGQWGVQEAEQATLIEKVLGLGPKDDPRDDMLEYVLAVIVEPFAAAPGIGWEAQLVKTLRGK